MKLVNSEDVENAIRGYLIKQRFVLSETKQRGETGCDLVATRGAERLFIEIIGFQSVAPIRSREFYELFFRTISRDTGRQEDRLVMALPARFAIGMAQRKRQYGLAWNKIGATFPNLEIWYIDTVTGQVKECTWCQCVDHTNAKPSVAVRVRKAWNPREGTIGFLVRKLLLEGRAFGEIHSEVMRTFPTSRFSKKHLLWYSNRLK
jgi:hypothetical protein